VPARLRWKWLTNCGFFVASTTTWPRPASPPRRGAARRERIYLEQRFSDHAPLGIDCDFKI
jgi:hypothetical protein